jgi:UDP-N-acetylglucosamine 1-carboxyvinyltransferase
MGLPMDKVIITGRIPEGGLKGTLKINGAKNACLPIMAATLLTEGTTILTEAPHLNDVETMRDLLESLGVKSHWVESGKSKRALQLDVLDDQPTECASQSAMEMRASICVLGPLLARRGSARVPLPGGCVIGQRPIDLHIKGLEALGAKVQMEKGYVCATAKRLKGARIYLGGPRGSTVLGTANVMMAAVLAHGTSVIEHAACEPEIQDLAHFLNACGAKISGMGTGAIIIEGLGRRKKGRLKGCMHTIIPDRIEAGTFACAAAATGGDVVLESVRPDHMTALMDVMRKMGIRFETDQQASTRPRRRHGDAVGQMELPFSGAWRAANLRVWRKGPVKPVEFTALPYPGIPTDMQPQLMAVLCTADGTSLINDSVYPERFTQVAELNRLGADIARGSSAGQAVVRGGAPLTGAPVHAHDLRGGASLILTGLVAEGETEVHGISHVDRGYEHIGDRLASLGAQVQTVSGSDEQAPQDKPERRVAS